MTEPRAVDVLGSPARKLLRTAPSFRTTAAVHAFTPAERASALKAIQDFDLGLDYLMSSEIDVETLGLDLDLTAPLIRAKPRFIVERTNLFTIQTRSQGATSFVVASFDAARNAHRR